MLARQSFRFPANYYLALASEVLRPALRTYARCWSSGSSAAPAKWRRGVLLGASHIGDVLYRSASLGALQAGLPDCEWHYLSERGSIPVLETNPALKGVIDGDLPRVGTRQFFEVAGRLRAGKFDVAVCYGTGTYWPELLLAAHAGIPNRVGYTHKGFSGLVTHPVTLQSPQPYPAHFRDLVAELTGQPPDWSLRPVIETTPADEAEAGAVWEALKLPVQEPVLACFVTTRQPAGQWERANYGRTLAELGERFAVRLLLCGARQDVATLDQLTRDYSIPCQVVAGKLSLRPLVAFLKRCSGVFTTDSGPRHLANAAGVPVLFMRNLWSPKIETGAYLDTEMDLAPDAELVPAGGEEAAFRNTSPHEVAERVAQRLGLSLR